MSFREIVGHRRLKRLLARAVHSGTLPPSLVFAGPEGVGKRQMAHALAQLLNCLEPVDGAAGERDACGTCGGYDDSCARPPRLGLAPSMHPFACAGRPARLRARPGPVASRASLAR